MLRRKKGKGLQAIRPNTSRRMKFWVVSSLLLFLLIVASELHITHYFPIRTVKVYGIHHIEQKDLQEMLLPLIQVGFFSVDIEEIRDRLMQVSWISSMVIKRTWPDQLDITIFEKQPIAKWNGMDLLTKKGELFLPQKDANPIIGLTELIGPPGKHNLVLSFYQEMGRIIEPLQMRIIKLELTPYYTWDLELNNHVKVQVGYQNAVYRMLRFVKVYPKIVGDRAEEVNYIDLRYSNGMAVNWKK